MDDYNGPGRYAPLGAWTYFGLSVLYALPIIGLIFLLIHTFSDANMNRRSFAWSYWCKALFIIILFAIAYGIAVATEYRDTENVQSRQYKKPSKEEKKTFTQRRFTSDDLRPIDEDDDY